MYRVYRVIKGGSGSQYSPARGSRSWRHHGNSAELDYLFSGFRLCLGV